MSLLSAKNRILPALITPLTLEGRLDSASAERLVEHLLEQGVGGFYVLGSTGEGIYLPSEVREQMLELVVRLARGRGQVIAHVGAVEGAIALRLAKHAERVGADAVASIPPFVGRYSWDEVYGFYDLLTQASSLPVVAYYFPSLTGEAISLDRLERLLALSGIAGVKVTDTNLYVMQRLSVRLRANQIIYNGPDELLALGLQFGAHGGIGSTYNLMPKLILAIAEHCARGEFGEALNIQRRANEVIEVLLSFPSLPATKQILHWQGLIASPACAAPRAALNDSEQIELRRRLSKTAIADSLVR